MRWYHANGLADFHSKFIAEPNFVDVAAAVKSVGCEPADVPFPIPYAGFKNDNDGHFGIVTGVDPDGPAAKAGLKTGDRILGFVTAADRKFNIAKERMPKFNYGFSMFPINDSVDFGISRNGKEMTLKITPREANDIATKRGFQAQSQRFGKFLKH